MVPKTEAKSVLMIQPLTVGLKYFMPTLIHKKNLKTWQCSDKRVDVKSDAAQTLIVNVIEYRGSCAYDPIIWKIK